MLSDLIGSRRLVLPREVAELHTGLLMQLQLTLSLSLNRKCLHISVSVLDFDVYFWIFRRRRMLLWLQPHLNLGLFHLSLLHTFFLFNSFFKAYVDMF